ncbi:MAG TPA: hypothetical protein VHP56_12760 [Solirubrobacterales bacterium]|jgi:hypothetical protein|nr:hypothetical protein [Solirubrobacterales bacterium]
MLKLKYFAVGVALYLLFVAVPGASAATWTIQTTPNATGAEHSNLYDIGCSQSATNPCVSVGKTTESGGKTAPYAQAWNGTSWSNITAKAPEGATAGELQSVDCAFLLESLYCYAAGSYTSGGVTKSLILSGGTGGFSGIQSTPNPEGASETALKGMACKLIITDCIAVGYSVKSGKKTAFVLRLSSESKWVILAMPEPEGAVSSELHGADCVSSTFCVAVGSYTDSGGSIWAMSATWNGTSWTLRTIPKPAGSIRTVLLDVSCSSASACAGVGIYRDSGGLQTSFVQRWNGSTWSHQSSANPVGSTNTVMQGVSCVASSPCVAVGDWNNGKSWLPMAQEFNGSSWVLDTTPNPEGATETILEGVACRTGGCLSSGWYKDSGGKFKTLGEKR